MASYSWQNISPVDVASSVSGTLTNLANVKDGDLSTWGKIYCSSASENAGYRLFFNFSTMPNGKVLPDDATINSWTIFPQSVSHSRQDSISSYYYGLGVRGLVRYSDSSNNSDENLEAQTSQYTDENVDVEYDTNGIVTEELKDIRYGTNSNRYFHIYKFANTYYWTGTATPPSSDKQFDVQSQESVERRSVEMVGFSSNSQLAITPQNLKTTFVTSGGVTASCLSPLIVMYCCNKSNMVQVVNGFGMNEVYANMTVTLPSITVSTVKSVPSGKDFTITGTGGDGQWSGTQITTDAWGGSTQSNITLTASNIPNDCYFVGWYKNGELIPGSGLSINFQPTENVTYTAQIALKPIVTFSSTEGGGVTVTTEGGEITSGTPVDIGTTINVSMVASGGYYFDSYTLNGSTTRPSEVYKYTFSYIVNADTDIYATFINNPVVTLSVQNANQNEQDSAGVEVSWDGSEWGSVVMENTMRPSGTLYCYAKDGDEFYFEGPMVDEFGTVLRWNSTRGCYEYDIPDKFQGRYSNIALFAYQKQKPSVVWAPYYIERNKAFPQVTEGGSTIVATVDGVVVNPGQFKPGTVINFTDTPNSASTSPHTEWGMWVTSAGEFLSSDISFNYTVPSGITDVAVIGGTYQWPSIQVHQYNKSGSAAPQGCTVKLDDTTIAGGDVVEIQPGNVSHKLEFIPGNTSFVYRYYDDITQETHTLSPTETAAGTYTYTFNVAVDNNKSFTSEVRFGSNPFEDINVGEHKPEAYQGETKGKFRIKRNGAYVTEDYVESWSSLEIRPGETITIEAEDWATTVPARVSGFYYDMEVTRASRESPTVYYDKTVTLTVEDEKYIECDVNFTGTTITSTQYPCTGTTTAGDVLTITANPSYTNRTSDVVMTATLAPADEYRTLSYIQTYALPGAATALGTTVDNIDFFCIGTVNPSASGAVDKGWAWIKNTRYPEAGYTNQYDQYWPTNGGASVNFVPWTLNRQDGSVQVSYVRTGRAKIDDVGIKSGSGSYVMLYNSINVISRDSSNFDWYYDGMDAETYETLYQEHISEIASNAYYWLAETPYNGFRKGNDHYRFDSWVQDGGQHITGDTLTTTFPTATQSSSTHEYTSNIDAYYRRYVILTLQHHTDWGSEAGTLEDVGHSDGHHDIGDNGNASATIKGTPASGYSWREWETEEGIVLSEANPFDYTFSQDTVVVGRFWHQFNISVVVKDFYEGGEEAGRGHNYGQQIVGTQLELKAADCDIYNYYLFEKWDNESTSETRTITVPTQDTVYTIHAWPKAKSVFVGSQSLWDSESPHPKVVAVYQGNTEIPLVVIR